MHSAIGDRRGSDGTLEINVFDLLATYRAGMGLATIDAGAGVRYAHIAQRYRHVEDPAANALLDAISSAHRFDGAGPTLNLRTSAAVLPRLDIFADLRYSVLFGEFEQRATTVVDNVLEAERNYSSEDFRHIGEIELGGKFVLPASRVNWFLDGGFVAQVWNNSGNAANNDIIVVLVDPEVSDKDADLALFGFRFGGGAQF